MIQDAKLTFLSLQDEHMPTLKKIFLFYQVSLINSLSLDFIHQFLAYKMFNAEFY